MKHIKLFEQFINEKASVPPGIIPYAEDLSKRVYDVLLELIKKTPNHQEGEIDQKFKFDKILSDKFPVSSVKSTISYKVIPGLRNMVPKGTPFDGVAAEGAFHGGSELVHRGSKFEVHIDVNISFDAEEFEEKKYEDEKFMLEKIQELFYHELLHGYEDVQRVSKNATNQISDSESQVYVAGSNAIRENVQMPEPISLFLYFIYISSAFEVSARNSSVWPTIRKTNDPHEREKILKTTIPWKAAHDLLDFTVEKFHDDIKKDIEENSLENLLRRIMGGGMDNGETAEEVMKNVVSSIKEAFKFINSKLAKSTFEKILKKKDFPETEAEHVQQELNRHAKDVEKISDDPKVFFKHWERIFHAAGEKAIRKMSKMTTAEM